MAYEIIHFMKCKTRGKQGVVALKVDIRKAYDMVEWGYLRAIMLKMGFDRKWVDWIMMCITSVSFSILVNNEAVGPVIPGRGLRQGDPLFSLSLYYLCRRFINSYSSCY